MKKRGEGMSGCSFNDLVEILETVLAKRNIKVLEVRAEDKDTWRLRAELYKGNEIGLHVCFGIHRNKVATYRLTYTLEVRWLKAETLMRDLRGPSPYPLEELTPAVIEARQKLYSIAQLRVNGDRGYFRAPSPIDFDGSEPSIVQTVFTDVCDDLMDKVVRGFSRYCFPFELAKAAIRPEKESRLLLAPRNVATILVVSGQREMFLKWRESYLAGVWESRPLRQDIKQQDEWFFEALLKHMDEVNGGKLSAPDR
jgi:hypothetical protein